MTGNARSFLVKAAQWVSLVALAGTITPAVLFLVDRMALAQVHSTMLVATVAWFVSAALWSADVSPRKALELTLQP